MFCSYLAPGVLPAARYSLNNNNNLYLVNKPVLLKGNYLCVKKVERSSFVIEVRYPHEVAMLGMGLHVQWRNLCVTGKGEKGSEW